MNNTLEYKGYFGSIEFSNEDNCFYGKILGINVLDHIVIGGNSILSLKEKGLI